MNPKKNHPWRKLFIEERDQSLIDFYDFREEGRTAATSGHFLCKRNREFKGKFSRMISH